MIAMCRCHHFLNGPEQFAGERHRYWLSKLWTPETIRVSLSKLPKCNGGGILPVTVRYLLHSYREEATLDVRLLETFNLHFSFFYITVDTVHALPRGKFLSCLTMGTTKVQGCLFCLFGFIWCKNRSGIQSKSSNANLSVANVSSLFYYIPNAGLLE